MCVCVSLRLQPPFNLERWNFGISCLMWISKNFFLKCLKNCLFEELLPFFYISLRFLCIFEERLQKWGKNLILFPWMNKGTEHKKIHRNFIFFAKSCQVFVMHVCLKSSIISNHYLYESITMDLGLLLPCTNVISRMFIF